ncbi:hypothetical protein BJX99DRAFT_270922 [Aspergillus californicus]
MTTVSQPSPALQGWHPGETAIQRRLGFASTMESRYTIIEDRMREQHKIFYTSNLPFIPLTCLDNDGRPWASIVSGAGGEIGFVSGVEADLKTLVFGVRLWEGDPFLEALGGFNRDHGQDKGGMLTAGLGIEFGTRRRNKFAGVIKGVRPLDGYGKGSGSETGLDYVVEVEVNEAVGNCPKYISIRQLDPYPNTNPHIAYQRSHMTSNERLPDDIITIITTADTVFVGSVYQSNPATASKYPSHAGMNARGGLPGFIRVSPSDGRSVVLPDYSGNRFMSSLGNIESSGLAAFTIVSFTTGDVLYLTGKAKVLIGPAALEVMARHASVTVLEVTGYTLVRDALPVRQRPGTDIERSPYSPKVKYLVEEAEGQSGALDAHQARLESAVLLSDDLARFKFKVVSKPGAGALRIQPGQAIVLDFMDWLGPPQYQHMANSAPGSINDDRVRTWTVSSAHEDQGVTWFELTMREMKGGAVTGALFDILSKHPLNNWGTLESTDAAVISDIVGVTGDFSLGYERKINALWVAGGIGITPFLAMLEALAVPRRSTSGDIVLALATREPDIMLAMIKRCLGDIPSTIKIKIDLFTRSPVTLDSSNGNQGMNISVHKGRIGPEYWPTVAKDRDVLICGPGEFGDTAVDGLRGAGVPNGRIQREGFY